MIRMILHILMIFSIACFFTTGCAKKPPQQTEDTAKAESGETDPSGSVKQKVLAFNLEGLADNGTKKWEVKGESAEAVSQNEVKLDNIIAKAYGEEAEATITANKGIYDKTKNNVRLEDNVKATIENTGSFTGDITDFSKKTPGSSISKDAKVADKKKTKTVITCDGEVEFDYEHNQAYFAKNVKVVSDDGNIDADKITINLEPATQKVGEIVAEGNVKISRGENVTYSEKATYIEAEKKILLTGKPRLVIYQKGSLEENMFGDNKEGLGAK